MRNPIRLLAACLVLASAMAKPTLFIIGDSTVRNQTAGLQGWGDPLVAHFDPAKIDVVNRAIGGRSSRTFLTEGRWDAVMANLKAGDFVIMQFGHNDGGKLNDNRCRASIKGIGEETEEIVRQTDGKPETVHSYGWYLRKYISDTKAKGATPIVLSLIPRNIWKDGKIGRSSIDGYGLWAKQAAEQGDARFIDFNHLLADRYEELGQQGATAIFGKGDHTHPNPAGAEINASVLATALRATSLGSNLLPADLWLPRIFSDHMVFQRDSANPVWGITIPGTEVTASIAGKTAQGKADANGHFRLELPALPAGGPHKLVVKAAAERTFDDVLIGEVWLCSGQSNMDFTVAKTEKRSFAGTTDWEQEVADANHPQLRMFTAGWTLREDPQRDVEGEWIVCSPESAGDFSAVAYFFGRELQRKLDVPVGLVTCAYGASTAEAWISKPKLASVPSLKPLWDDFWKKFIAYRDNPKPFEDHGKSMEKWTAAGSKGRAPRHPDPMQDQHNPSVLFNGMIAPLAPYGIRGAIWYQGESNVGTRKLYPDLQKALIEDWRDQWKRGSFPFYFVQLAPHKQPSPAPSNSSLATMREAQASSLALPNTGMAVTLDIGDAKDVHPRNKQDVGRRLARLALSGTYEQDIVPCGPILKMSEIEDGMIILHFDHIGGGLVAKGGPLRQFAIAGDDRKFVRADATIAGDTVIVSSATVPRPAYVRYAWADNPQGANFFNNAGLPAAPFRTDP